MPYPAPKRVDEAKEFFDEKALKELQAFIESNVKVINSKLETFRTSKIPEMVRLYKGIPKNEEVDFPWPGAANLQIQLIGTFCDELLARIMGSIYQYDPLWVILLSGDNPQKSGDDEKKILETFLMDEAYDPESLDLYRVENSVFTSAIKYGTGVCELPWDYTKEQEYVFSGGGDEDKSPIQYRFKETVIHDGPKPRLVPLNKFGIDPSNPTLAGADFFYTIETLKYWQVKNLPDRSKLYSQEDIDAILQSPDRNEVSDMQREVDDAMNIDNSNTDKGSEEWDFYNCYMKFQHKGKTYSIIAKYHFKSRKVLFAVFNFYPQNIFPVEDVKLAYDDETYFGTGYAMMLRAYQKELSQNSNWRTNNRNFAMMGMLRVDPDAKLSSTLQFYPGALLPGKDGQIERISNGADIGYNDGPDQFIMALAKERAGVDPAIGGTGGGLVNNKRGIYSASGTSMMLLQQNNRNNLRMSDMRSFHVKLAIKLMAMYVNFGIGDKLKKYGDKGETLKKAFSDYKEKALGFRLRPTTANNNKELDRQNDVLLRMQSSAYTQEMAQMIQAISQPNMPPALQDFYMKALLSHEALMKEIFGNFNHPDTQRLVPGFNPQLMQGPQQGAPNGQSGGAAQSGAPAQQSIPGGGLPAAGQIPH